MVVASSGIEITVIVIVVDRHSNESQYRPQLRAEL